MNISYFTLGAMRADPRFKRMVTGTRLEKKSGVRRTNSGSKWFFGAWLKRWLEVACGELTGPILARIFFPDFMILRVPARELPAASVQSVPLLLK